MEHLLWSCPFSVIPLLQACSLSHHPAVWGSSVVYCISAGLSFDRQCAWGRRGRQKALVFGKKQARQPEREGRGSMRIRLAWRVQIENQTKPPCGHMRLTLNASYPANWMSSRPATQGTHTKCASTSMMERSPPGGKPSCLRSETSYWPFDRETDTFKHDGIITANVLFLTVGLKTDVTDVNPLPDS
jgi:hypothetical protein